MTVLVLGASGMLGHKLMQALAPRCRVIGTVRGAVANYAEHPVLGVMQLAGGVRVEDFDSLIQAFDQVRPQAVINCIGVVKQLTTAQDPVTTILINALFPHQLLELCSKSGCRLVHLSTDCVFAGTKGSPYSEDDVPDALDLYGRSKLLGEVDSPGSVTLRTSMIGRELQGSRGLLEWFIRQRGGHVDGFSKAYFTGLTTIALAEIVARIVLEFPALSGILHLAADPISKYELLQRLNLALDLHVNIQEQSSFHCDRRLDGTRFQRATGLSAPNWSEMIQQLTTDPTPYVSN